MALMSLFCCTVSHTGVGVPAIQRNHFTDPDSLIITGSTCEKCVFNFSLELRIGFQSRFFLHHLFIVQDKTVAG